MRRLLILLLAVSVAAALPGCAPEREETVAERSRRIHNTVWSPYCPGQLLSECPTRQSDELRASITERLEAGQSEEQVLAWVRENYGDEMLATPGPGLAGLVVWLVPVAAVLAGAVLVGGLVFRWSRPASGSGGARVGAGGARGEPAVPGAPGVADGDQVAAPAPVSASATPDTDVASTESPGTQDDTDHWIQRVRDEVRRSL